MKHGQTPASTGTKEECMCFSCFGLSSPGRPYCGDFPARCRVACSGARLGFALRRSLRCRPRTRQSRAARLQTDFVSGIKDIIAKANSPELVAFQGFRDQRHRSPVDRPWSRRGAGQQVTFLLTGRMWLSREHDLWFGPGLVFHARTRGLPGRCTIQCLIQEP